MRIHLAREGQPVTALAIANFEKANGVALPDEIAWFLQHAGNGGRLKPLAVLPVPCKDFTDSAISGLYGIGDFPRDLGFALKSARELKPGIGIPIAIDDLEGQHLFITSGKRETPMPRGRASHSRGRRVSPTSRD